MRISSRIKIFFIVITIFLASCTNLNHTEQSFVQYDDPHNQYSILYPSEWDKIEGSKETVDITFASRKKSTLDNAIEQFLVKTVEIKLKDKSVNFDEIVQSIESDPKYQVIDVKDIKIGDLPTKQIKYSRVENESEVEEFIQQTYLLKGSYAYVLTFMCKKGDEEKYSELVNKVFGSFTIK